MKLSYMLGLVFVAAMRAAVYPAPTEGDWIAKNFKFTTGETLPELRLHYTTVGKPQRDASGKVVNAVLILHGTGGVGQTFLKETFAGQLFGPGQLLDGAAHYIILPESGMENPANPAMECVCVSRNTPTPTWCGRSTCC